MKSNSSEHTSLSPDTLQAEDARLTDGCYELKLITDFEGFLRARSPYPADKLGIPGLESAYRGGRYTSSSPASSGHAIEVVCLVDSGQEEGRAAPDSCGSLSYFAVNTGQGETSRVLIDEFVLAGPYCLLYGREDGNHPVDTGMLEQYMEAFDEDVRTGKFILAPPSSD